MVWIMRMAKEYGLWREVLWLTDPVCPSVGEVDNTKRRKSRRSIVS